MSDGDGPIGNYASPGAFERILPHGPGELRALADFYAEDAFDEEMPFGGLDPSSYPMFEQAVRQVHTEDAALVEGRHLEEDLQHVARDARPPALLRQYTLKYRMPPRPGVDRLCPRGAQCRFRAIAPAENGYTGREFVPDERAPLPETPGVCIDCYLYELSMRVYGENQTQGAAPVSHANMFAGADDYGEHAVLPPQIEDRPTGLAGGPVPAYHLGNRAWLRIEEADRIRFGLETHAAQVYLAEINVEPVAPVALPPPSYVYRSHHTSP